jgi:hypothetical protein
MTDFKERNKDITLIDLRLEYKRKTGHYPIIRNDNSISGTLFKDSKGILDYIKWLEDELIKLKNLHRKFIPWEPVKTVYERKHIDYY